MEEQKAKAGATQNRSGAPEAMDDFAAIRNRQVLDRATGPDARHHDGTHARPVRPSFVSEGMAPEVAASRAPSASTVSIHAALDEQADLGAASVGFRAAELSAALRCTGCFFLCARAGGVAWRVAWRVACFGPLNPLGPSGKIPPIWGRRCAACGRSLSDTKQKTQSVRQ